MNKIGIVICNFNKREYLSACIDSIFNSSIDYYDIFVVDNASTDGSVDMLKEKYSNRITILENPENIGGSGGFHQGLLEVKKLGYPYIMCVDNDIIMEKDNIEKLYLYLEDNSETGMVGSRVMYMDHPDTIQSMGAMIDFEKYSFSDNYHNYKLTNQIPKVMKCDYVPACSMMVRANILEEIGLIPRDNFVYWDDIEWGYLCTKAGYRVVCLKDAWVRHKGNFKSTSTFSKYYMLRNRIHFFAKYLPEEKIEDFCIKCLTELFRMIYACRYKGELNIIKTLMYAYDDAIHNKRGKAEDWKIFQRDKVVNRIQNMIETSKLILIHFDGDFDSFQEIIGIIRKISENIFIQVMLEEKFENEFTDQFPGITIVREYSQDIEQTVFKMCSHVFDIYQYNEGSVYIDKWGNIIKTTEDYDYCRQFKNNLDLFLHMNKDLLYHKIMEIRAVKN